MTRRPLPNVHSEACSLLITGLTINGLPSEFRLYIKLNDALTLLASFLDTPSVQFEIMNRIAR